MVHLRKQGPEPEMKCPNCDHEIDAAAIAKHLGAKGGKAGKRELTSEQARELVAKRWAKRRSAVKGEQQA